MPKARSQRARKTGGPRVPGIPEDEFRKLVSGVHPDPHAWLGLHLTGSGAVVRVWRPDAAAVSLIRAGAVSAMRKTRPEGLFEISVTGETEIFPYRLRIASAGGESTEIDDPYAQLPRLGDVDVYLAREGSHDQLYEKLGAHVFSSLGWSGVGFAAWAPNAHGVSVTGDFNRWDGRIHPMRNLGGSGIWELFIPGLAAGTIYKFEIRSASGSAQLKADPYAFRTEAPPNTASIVDQSHYAFRDEAWIRQRNGRNILRGPMSIYEMHIGSWRRVPEEGNRSLTYLELAPILADYLADMGFTHVELLPVMEHPFGGSWGYQVSSYFAPTARFGSPDDLRYLIDLLHRRGIGVILDWVPAHFPKDAFALGRFDGTALYEHLDPRQGEHPDWGTFVFNYARPEVKNFLLASALYWLSEYHADGLRLDAVASMLYLDYSRKRGEWVPNRLGGRENLEAIELLKELNTLAHGRHPGTAMIAEESTAWPGVSRPTYVGGLGFGLKWDMGWMHDTLRYFSKDPLYRHHHHNDLTFGLLYAWTENFVLPLSHDEVVHGKGSLLSKMPGSTPERFANLRALFGYMWARPGKKMLFMGGEIGQWSEWSHDRSLDWHLLGEPGHRGIQALVRDLNRIYRSEPALWEADTEADGYQWINADDSAANVISFIRKAPSNGSAVVCVCNFSGTVQPGYRIGLPRPGWYREILNTDAQSYGGEGRGNLGGLNAESKPWLGFPASTELILPPLSALWFEVPR